jgi:hypothetical protein
MPRSVRLIVQVRPFPGSFSLCTNVFVRRMTSYYYEILTRVARYFGNIHPTSQFFGCSLWRHAILMLLALPAPGPLEPLLLRQDEVSLSRLNNSWAQLGIQLLFRLCREIFVPSVSESSELVIIKNAVVIATNHFTNCALTDGLGRIVRVMLAANCYASSQV